MAGNQRDWIEQGIEIATDFASKGTEEGLRLFSQSIDHNRWDWSQLDPSNAESFVWKSGVTPLSDWQVVVGSIIAYYTTLIALRLFMSGRQPMKLTKFLVVHNFILTIWSLVMFIAVVIDVYNLFKAKGFEGVNCARNADEAHGSVYYSLYIYYISKFYELFDTVFLVLKKKKVIFLHWYHHSIVIVLVWTWLQYSLVYTSLGMIFNTGIHIFMYYYYCIQSMGLSVWFKKYITSGQIVQFISSFLLSIPFIVYHLNGGCLGFGSFLFSLFCNASFLILFIQFYSRTYKSKED